jgi:hypothetical protein
VKVQTIEKKLAINSLSIAELFKITMVTSPAEFSVSSGSGEGSFELCEGAPQCTITRVGLLR